MTGRVTTGSSSLRGLPSHLYHPVQPRWPRLVAVLPSPLSDRPAASARRRPCPENVFPCLPASQPASWSDKLEWPLSPRCRLGPARRVLGTRRSVAGSRLGAAPAVGRSVLRPSAPGSQAPGGSGWLLWAPPGARAVSWADPVLRDPPATRSVAGPNAGGRGGLLRAACGVGQYRWLAGPPV